MPEILNDKKIYSLWEVSNSISKTLNDRYKKSFWLKAEIIKLNYYKHSGHCYPDLVEKKNDKVIAQMRATIWKLDFFQISRKFKKITGEELNNGMQVLMEVQINFDALHGISLHIIDIDPSFSLGLMEQEKMQTLLRLKEENLFDLNRKLAFPLLPRKIALISVETSKGYADFINILESNGAKYNFQHLLFPSILQGEDAIKGIIYQLKRIFKVVHHFDVVAIVRGGGGDVGLSCYNNFLLAKAIARFPIPVITGIGHATNETVVEMIAHKNGITPTALAQFLIDKVDEFVKPLEYAKEKLAVTVRNNIRHEQQSLNHNIERLTLACTRTLDKNHRNLELASQELRFNMERYFEKQRTQIQQHAHSIKLCNPEKVLQRGYSMIYKDEKTISSISDLREGDLIKAVLFDGSIEAKVEKTITLENHE